MEKSKQVLENETGSTKMNKWHDVVTAHVRTIGVGSMYRVGEETMRLWMRGTYQAKGGLKKGALAAFQDYIDCHGDDKEELCKCLK